MIRLIMRIDFSPAFNILDKLAFDGFLCVLISTEFWLYSLNLAIEQREEDVSWILYMLLSDFGSACIELIAMPAIG